MLNTKTKETREVKYYLNDDERENYFYNNLELKVISNIDDLTFYINSKEYYDREIESQFDAWVENSLEYNQKFESKDYYSYDQDNDEEIAF